MQYIPPIPLLPVKGSDAQWYKSVHKNPSFRIEAKRARLNSRAVPITDSTEVSSVIEKCRNKYGAGDAKKCHSTWRLSLRFDDPWRMQPQDLCRGNGCRFQAIDLRWGVT